MDISIIKPEETNTKTGLWIGSKDAPKIMKEFINLRCPYCRQWFNDSKEILDQAVSEEKIARLIKLADRQKESLQRGNVMHRFVSTTNPQKALEEIQAIFDTQNEWGNLSLEEVAEFAKNQLSLTEHNHLEYSEEIVTETENAVIKFVPTIIFENHIFDENISSDELEELIK